MGACETVERRPDDSSLEPAQYQGWGSLETKLQEDVNRVHKVFVGDGLHAQIVGHRFEEQLGTEVYLIHAHNQRIPSGWDLTRAFRDFDKLHTDLAQDADLLPSKFLRKGNDEMVIQERVVKLQELLDALLADAATPELLTFLEVPGGPKGDWGWSSGKVHAPPKFKRHGFTLDEAVSWTDADEDVKEGAVGKVTGFTKDDVEVRFDSGTFRFGPDELLHATAP